jgi:hypothetical protein
MNPFDYVNSINSGKDIITGSENEEFAEKEYKPFLTNKAFSYYPDTIAHANAMNLNHFLDNKMQYDYLLNSIRPSKRFAKWVKKQDSNDLEVVKEYYGYGNAKAYQALDILSSEQLETIKEKLEKGGP